MTDAVLELVFRDDESDNPSEGFKIWLGRVLQPGNYNAEVSWTGEILGALLASLQQDGVLHVTITHQHGDFMFERSALTARSTGSPRARVR